MCTFIVFVYQNKSDQAPDAFLVQADYQSNAIAQIKVHHKGAYRYEAEQYVPVRGPLYIGKIATEAKECHKKSKK